MGESPLQSVDPNSINELFQLDPLKLTDQQIEKGVEYFRNLRAGWLKAENEGKKPKAAKGVPAPEGLTLDDLGI